MKKHIFLILSIVIMMLAFLSNWYSDELFDTFFIFALVPDLIILAGYVICLVATVVFLFKDLETDEAYLSKVFAILILVLMAIVVFNFPFRACKMNVELTIYDKQRTEVVNMVKEKELEADDYGNVELPFKFKKLSSSGEVAVYQNDEDGIVVAFWIFRGMLSGSTQLIYSSQGEELIRANETGHPIISIEQVKEHWFYVETDY